MAISAAALPELRAGLVADDGLYPPGLVRYGIAPGRLVMVSSP